MTDVKILTLFKDMIFSPEGSGSDLLYRYESMVTKKTLSSDGPFLTGVTLCGRAVLPEDNDGNLTTLAAGKYFFIQYGSSEREKAAEALWLESLWLDINLDSTVYERVLEEDGKTVFQLFRKITDTAEDIH